MELHVPPGHPYSPIPSPQDIARTASTDEGGIHEIPGVDLRIDEQWDLVNRLLPDYPAAADLLRTAQHYRLDNNWFAGADAVFTVLMLRHLQPGRVIEVGCGYSSALVADTLPGADVTMIDPDPTRVSELLGDVPHLLPQPVQDVPLSVFDVLRAGDVLMVDSSHVVRAGSDVHHLLFNVLPRLPQGVFIHVHDIFFPFEYPRMWLDAGVSFNEAYAWRAVLMNARSPRIELWNHLLMRQDPDWFARNMPLVDSAPFPVGGLWVRT